MRFLKSHIYHRQSRPPSGSEDLFMISGKKVGYPLYYICLLATTSPICSCWSILKIDSDYYNESTFTEVPLSNLPLYIHFGTKYPKFQELIKDAR